MCTRQRFIVSLVSISLLIAAGLTYADDSGLVGWWRFDEGTGTGAADSSGSGNDGTVVGAEWVAPGWDQKGYCLEFLYADDESDLVDLGTMDVVGEGITITGWVTPYTFTQNDARVISKSSTGATGDGHWWMLSTLNGVNVRFRLKTNESNTTLTLIDTAGVLVTGEWQFVTARWDGTTASTYVNTVETGSAAKGGTAVATDASVPVAIGNQPATAGDGPRAWDGLIDDVRVYNRALTMEELAEVMLGGGPGANTELASAPAPGDGQTDVPRDTALRWTAGELAGTHDVYFGAAAADVEAAERANPLGVLVGQGQTATTYEPPTVLEFGQTYYWRVDEVNATPDRAIFKGALWSFTVEPFAYPIANIVATTNASSDAGAGPENTVNGSGLNAEDEHSIAATDMWLATPSGAEPVYIQYEFDGVYKLHEMLVWNYNVQFELVLGFGLKDVTIEYSQDGAEWMSLGAVEFAKATATAGYTANTTVDLQGVAARYVRLTVNSGWGMLGQHGLSEVRFLSIPVQPREPQPAAGATDVSPAAGLAWRAGREAASHEVYLGTDPEALELADTVTRASLTPGDLLFGQTYYWKVSEVNEAEAIATWEGPVWDFMTQEYATIDDMESYNDEDNTIYDTWLDGWVNETGSTVGYLEAPFAERSIVHGGSQSMPLTYDNTAAPFYSEAEYDVGGMDWDIHGADTLRLFVSGQAPDFFESTDGTIVMNAIGDDIWNTADQGRYVYKQLTGAGSMTVRVDYLDGTPSTWAKGGVMVRQNTEAGAINAFVAMTGGGRGATFQQRLEADASSVSQHTYEGNPFAPPYWVKLERAGSAVSAFISPDGQTWQQAGDTATVALTDSVLIGLALTSHDAGVATSATFSNVSTTGNVSGSWQVAEIGVEQPTGGNDAETLYVAIEDSAGNVAVATHPDAAVRSGWTEWLIPYSDLTGVNLNSVRMMYIGLGNRDNPSAGGSGLIFIDDIAFGHPAGVE
ncbi:MAG: discoidin domain-containing protein [Phycisphaerales bacterium]|nr:MAG: discoidin domain-containing protein [Phycisphaerales bacterium]